MITATKMSMQGHGFTKFLWGGGSEVTLRNVYVCDLFLSNSSSPRVLCPVNCPPQVHCTTILPPRDGKIFEVRESGSPHTPVKFRPCLYVLSYNMTLVSEN